MGNVSKLYALEIGNEVDVYARQCYNGSCIRNPQTWDSETYAEEVQGHIDLLTKNVTNFPQTGRIFQIFDKGTEIDWPTNTKWTLTPFMQSISEVEDLTRVKQVAQHYRPELTSYLATRHMLAETLIYKTRNPQLDFVLSEVGNAIGSSSNKTTDAILESSLGSAVWTVDWMLCVMSINVTRINMQMGRIFGFAAWQPNQLQDAPPHLKGGFYGHVFVADFISNQGSLRVIELPQPSGNKNISAYARFHHGTLTKVALINQELWLGSSNRPRASNVSLNLEALGPDVPARVKVQKLWGPSANTLTNISWAGLDWPFNNITGGGTPVKKRQRYLHRN
ncbi:family 79 glycoside hydrolase [Cryphonectria parasitica EP155]|uniref:Family 79 glycoside hydrolase n=1 Tax=Cryphonectria parasitica (strain ATCC 38755 / EP155) TaxID=660469 RepID=A0A9P4XUS7_CRYP1|nr:family 79 glycoside hydrolase [Cryphonectria parasitica EP155]KAF3761202.1 family 79 glycoside hydrolase [Cryphonectria parasitica EP155]